MSEVLELMDADVLEYLDHNSGSAYVTELARRGIGNDVIERDDVRVLLTDRGAAAIEGPVEPVESPLAEPEPQEEPMEAQTIDQHRAAEANGNGGGATRDRILALLAEHPDGLQPVRVAELLGLTRENATQHLRRLAGSGDAEKVPLGNNRRQGILYFIAGEAKIPHPPDLRTTTKPKPQAKRRQSRSPARVEAGKPPPSDPGDLDRYIGALGRLAMIEAPPTEVIERLERVLELDAKVRGADG